MLMQIGRFLIRRLTEIKVQHIFGVPGDFNLTFLEQIEDTEKIKFIGNCNELNAAYAADGYARTSGIGALLTTFGVGDLGAISGIAGAYAENIPLICITGAPPLHARAHRDIVHHSLANGDYDNIGRCMAEFSVAQANITPANAVYQIDHALHLCWLERRPVYIQLPSDITQVVIDVPDSPLVLTPPHSDINRLHKAAQDIIERLLSAKSPVILIDTDADRFNVTDLIVTLSQQYHIPLAAVPSAKGFLNQHSPYYIGVYAGAASLDAVRTKVENSDCLIGIGLKFSDVSTFVFSHQINPDTLINLRCHDLSIGKQNMQGVILHDLLNYLVDHGPIPLEKYACQVPTSQSAIDKPVNKDSLLTQASLWGYIQKFVKSDDIIFGDIGTANVGVSSIKLPPGARYISQAIWAAIGYSLPALLGSLMAAPKQRHLLFIGDGAMQMTVQELSSILRYQLKPIIFLLNNAGYTIERFFCGEHSSYNDIADWKYAKLPYIFADKDDILSLIVETNRELEYALQQAESADKLTFIELKLPKMDCLPSMKNFCSRSADYDYGERFQ